MQNAVGKAARVRIADGVAQAAVGQVGALRQEQAAAFDAVLPAVIRPQAGEHAQERGLADAAFAFEQQPFGRGGGEADGAQHGASCGGVDGGLGEDKGGAGFGRLRLGRLPPPQPSPASGRGSRWADGMGGFRLPLGCVGFKNPTYGGFQAAFGGV